MKKAELWAMVFIIGILGFSWPFIEIFNRALVAYLFVFWFIFVVLVAFVGFRAR